MNDCPEPQKEKRNEFETEDDLFLKRLPFLRRVDDKERRA